MMTSLFLVLWACHNNVISRQEGLASYYADRFQDRETASGELYDTSEYTAAHRDLPFGQKIRVIRKDNGNTVLVTVNDRGPYNQNRIIDLSKAAAKDLEMLEEGVLEVTLEILKDK